MGDITNRLRCKYPVGEMVDGKPEFGWRDVGGPMSVTLPTPIMIEAATEIESLRARVAQLEEALDSFAHYGCDCGCCSWRKEEAAKSLTSPSAAAENAAFEVQSAVPPGWHVEKNTKPIPDRNHDWDFWHDDYDGADGGNGLSGTAPSYEDAVRQIEEREFTPSAAAEANDSDFYGFKRLETVYVKDGGTVLFTSAAAEVLRKRDAVIEAAKEQYRLAVSDAPHEEYINACLATCKAVRKLETP